MCATPVGACEKFKNRSLTKKNPMNQTLGISIMPTKNQK